MLFYYIVLLLAAILTYLFIRNNEVLKYRQNVNNRCFNYNIHHIDNNTYSEDDNAFKFAYDAMKSYDSMVYSIIPLRDKYWLSQEAIDKLNSIENENNKNINDIRD